MQSLGTQEELQVWWDSLTLSFLTDALKWEMYVKPLWRLNIEGITIIVSARQLKFCTRWNFLNQLFVIHGT